MVVRDDRRVIHSAAGVPLYKRRAQRTTIMSDYKVGRYIVTVVLCLRREDVAGYRAYSP